MAGQEFEMTFHCTFPDYRLCPSSYIVLLHGPSRQSIPPELFAPRNWTNEFNDYASVRVRWTIHDAGNYNVYAYPEFVNCSQWKNMDYPWNKAVVQGSPFQLSVTPSIHREEGHGACSDEDVDDGRYLSTDALSAKGILDYAGLGREFIYTPYKCKIPHRSIEEAVDLLPSAKHFLIIGDSTTRGGFCARMWESLHGTVNGSVCDYKNALSDYWDMKWGHKFTSKTFEKTEWRTAERNVRFSFLWVGHNFSDVLPALLDLATGDSPPTHVVFNMGVYISCDANSDGLRGTALRNCNQFTCNSSRR